ncbi:MAG TPA: UbiA-like polyprenyltransferase [Planctomycetota bacterium]|nr:UbiA-like polyprenyltransferase [Planctomycetota bacterium]
MLSRLAILLDSIKFAHSIFALPFALVAMIVAAGGWPGWRVAGLIVLCMVAARSAAMAFNRIVDREIDANNPRTRNRPTVTGAVSLRFAQFFFLVASAIYWAATWFLNTVCFILALPVLAILLGYSLSKRFTALCHFWLGLSLGLAPIAAHLAVRGDLKPLAGLGARWGLPVELFPILLCVTVVCWVSGFDLIYACQDYDADCRDSRLHSTPKSLGIVNALRLSSVLHALAVVLLVATGYYAGMGVWYYLATGAIAALLSYGHWIVSPTDLTRVNVAFFTVNGMVSLLLLASVVIERMLLKP